MKQPKIIKPITFRFKHMGIRLYTDPVSYFNREKLLQDDVFGVMEFNPSFNCGHISNKDNIIRFLLHPSSNINEVMRVVAHELGHKIEGGFKKNPPDNYRYAKRHEDKAEHYEFFAINALKLSQTILKHLRNKNN